MITQNHKLAMIMILGAFIILFVVPKVVDWLIPEETPKIEKVQDIPILQEQSVP